MLAKNANTFMLFQERSPLSMLPPPLNVIPAVIAFIHYYWLSKAKTEAKQELSKPDQDIIDIATSLYPGDSYQIDKKAKPNISHDKYTFSYAGTISDCIIKYVLLLIFINFFHQQLFSL